MKLKKILAAVLAGVMVVASAVPAMAETTDSTAESVTGLGWWTGVTTSKYELADGDTVVFTVDYTAEDENGEAGQLTLEVSDGSIYIDSNLGVQGNAWTAYDTADAIIESDFEDGFALVEGHTYTATVTRDGNVYTFEYYDVTEDAACYTTSVTTDSALADASVYVIAQLGSYDISAEKVVVEEVTNSDTITGLGWWTGVTSSKYALADGESVEFNVDYDAEDVNGEAGQITLEVTDGTIFIDSNFGVQGNAWTAYDTADAVIESDFEDGFALVEGHSYTVTVTREGNVYTFEYYDVTEDAACYTTSVTTDSALADASVYVIAQLGTFTVSVTTTEEGVVTPPTTPDDTNVTEEEEEEEEEEEDPVVGTTLDCSGWWTTFSSGFAITEELTTYKFTNTSYENPADVWCGPVYIIYAGDEKKVNGEGYTELLVSRADGNAWFFDGSASHANAVGNGAADKANILGDATGDLPEGYSFTVTALPADWDAYIAAIQAGVEVTVTTQIVDGKAVITSSCAGMDYTVEVPVGEAEVLYLSFSGENTTLENLYVNDVLTTWGGDANKDEDETPDEETPAEGTPSEGTNSTSPKTADTMPIIPVAAALAGCAVIAVVAKKKVVK